jgi:hypothetical protein
MAIRLLLAVMMVASCAKAGLTADSGLQQDGAAQIVPGMDSLPVSRDLLGVEANACPGRLTGQCDDCNFPLDWASAQDPSRWCRLYQTFPPTSLALCPEADGYNRAILAYNTGGEMGIVDRLFFLYDSTTGVFVQQQSQPWPSEEATCVFGLPGQSLHWAPACQFFGTSLESACGKDVADAG